MKFDFNFIIQIILFICIVNQENIIDNIPEFKGVYRIDSLFNHYSLTDENYCLQCFDGRDKISQMYKFIKTENSTFYIEVKKNGKRLGVNKIGHVLTVYSLKDKNYKNTMEWNIIKIDENQYLIQNTENLKFMEINNNFIQCINDLPFPYEEYKSEINNTYKFSFFKLFDEVEITEEQEKRIQKEPIDVVIKYIDLTDETLNRTGIKQIQKDLDNEELRYSVRSILQNIPWVRKIFIVMPNDKVKYFKPYKEIKDKIVYVKDKDILGFDSANIYAFTFNLFKLEKFGLSKNFIYMDDDFFIGKELNKSNFFYYEENEKKVVPSLLNVEFGELYRDKTLEHYENIFVTKDNIGTQSFLAWALSLYSTEKFFLDYYKDMTLINPTPSHNAISYNIQDLKEIYELVINNYEYANDFLNSIERHILTLQTQHFVDLYALNIKKRKVHSISFNVIPMNLIKLAYLNKELFAINTGGDRFYTREEYKNQKEIMEIRFPNATPYEIIEDNFNNINSLNTPYNAVHKNNENNNINIFNSNENNNKYNPTEDENNNINEIKMDNSHLSELEKNNLVQTNIKQYFIIKTAICIIIILIILIILLFYLYLNEKNKYRYNRLYENENKTKLEVVI